MTHSQSAPKSYCRRPEARGGESFFLASCLRVAVIRGEIVAAQRQAAGIVTSQKTMYTHPINSIAATTGVIEIPPARRGWKSLQFNLRGFPQLYAARGCCVAPLPDFSINGLHWSLVIYPGGSPCAEDDYLSAFLSLHSGRSTTVTWEISVIDTFGRKKNSQGEATSSFAVAAVANSDGWDNLIRRSFVLDPSNKMLDGYGTLSFVISVKDKQNHFVPTNPLSNAIRGLFLDEASADVCIEVTMSETKEDGKKKVKVLGSYPAHSHRFILKTCAPMLAALCESNSGEGTPTVSLTGIRPSVFFHLLLYVYGGGIPKLELKSKAKEIIDAADKYSIVNLKLEAEAVYVESTRITVENAIDNLLYADSKNLALLKETVIDFLADNGEEVIGKIEFKDSDMPGNIVKDVLVAVARNKKEVRNEVISGLNVMRVSELRRKLDEKGLNVDGSRETMIEALKSSAVDS